MIRNVSFSGEIILKRCLKSPCRAIHTIRMAAAFCKKGSMTHLNNDSGEDAVICQTWITPGNMQGTTVLGVTDGVGGWNRYGIDPSKLSKGLLSELNHLFLAKESDIDTNHAPSLRELLETAFQALIKKGEDEYAGGTTVCVGIFDPHDPVLRIVNIGDSGAIVLRDGKIIHSTDRDVQGLVPQQLTIMPEWLNDIRESQLAAANQPMLKPDWMKPSLENAKEFEFGLKDGDLILFATDGLWDNVYPAQIEKILDPSQTSPLEEIAEKLVRRAYYNSLDPYFASPHAVRGMLQGFDHFAGGKPDDISIVLARITETGLI